MSGPAALDVARTAVFLRYMGVRSPDEARLREALAGGYLDAYLSRTGLAPEDVERCKPLVASSLLRYVPGHPEAAALHRVAAL